MARGFDESKITRDFRGRFAPKGSSLAKAFESLDTDRIHRGPKGDWTPERKALHDRIEAEILKGVTPVDDPSIHFLGGGPASGKSTAMAKPPDNTALIDSDHIKSLLPEYQGYIDAGDPRAAALVHEESSYLAKRITTTALSTKRNVLLDGTGDSSIEKLGAKVAEARKAGHRVKASYVTVDTDEAVRRAKARAKKTGRHVPESVIRMTHASVSRTFADAIKHDLFDEVDLFDTNTRPPLHVLTGRGDVKILDAAAWERFLAKAQASGAKATSIPTMTTALEHKAVPVGGVEVLDEDRGIVEAIVSVTGVVDRVHDVILPGAYEKSLKVRTPKGIWHHDWKTPVARTLDVKELLPGDPRLPSELSDGSPWPTEAGALVVKAQFNLETQRGREAFSDVTFFDDQGEWSVGYQVPKGKAKSIRGQRHIEEMDLFEYSPVLFGAMPMARTLSRPKDAQEAWAEVKGAIFGTCDDGNGTCCLTCGTKVAEEKSALDDEPVQQWQIAFGSDDVLPIVGPFPTEGAAKAWLDLYALDGGTGGVIEAKGDLETKKASRSARKWAERLHKRDNNGKFASKGGGGSSRGRAAKGRTQHPVDYWGSGSAGFGREVNWSPRTLPQAGRSIGAFEQAEYQWRASNGLPMDAGHPSAVAEWMTDQVDGLGPNASREDYARILTQGRGRAEEMRAALLEANKPGPGLRERLAERAGSVRGAAGDRVDAARGAVSGRVQSTRDAVGERASSARAASVDTAQRVGSRLAAAMDDAAKRRIEARLGGQRQMDSALQATLADIEERRQARGGVSHADVFGDVASMMGGGPIRRGGAIVMGDGTDRDDVDGRHLRGGVLGSTSRFAGKAANEEVEDEVTVTDILAAAAGEGGDLDEILQRVPMGEARDLPEDDPDEDEDLPPIEDADDLLAAVERLTEGTDNDEDLLRHIVEASAVLLAIEEAPEGEEGAEGEDGFVEVDEEGNPVTDEASDEGDDEAGADGETDEIPTIVDVTDDEAFAGLDFITPAQRSELLALAQADGIDDDDIMRRLARMIAEAQPGHVVTMAMASRVPAAAGEPAGGPGLGNLDPRVTGAQGGRAYKPSEHGAKADDGWTEIDLDAPLGDDDWADDVDDEAKATVAGLIGGESDDDEEVLADLVKSLWAEEWVEPSIEEKRANPGKFKPDLHPRGPDGKFIRKGNASGVRRLAHSVGRGAERQAFLHRALSRDGRRKAGKSRFKIALPMAQAREKRLAERQNRKASNHLAKWTAAAAAAREVSPGERRDFVSRDLGIDVNDLLRSTRRDIRKSGADPKTVDRLVRNLDNQAAYLLGGRQRGGEKSLPFDADPDLAWLIDDAALDLKAESMTEDEVFDEMAALSPEDLEHLIKAVDDGTFEVKIDELHPGTGEFRARHLIRWFERGGGAAKIRWGVKGDFMRCVRIASKHMRPDQARGFCNKRHQGATGSPPGKGPHAGVPGKDALGLDFRGDKVWIGTEVKAFEAWVTEHDDDLPDDEEKCDLCEASVVDDVCSGCGTKGLRRFVESLHRRAPDGKFAPKGGGGGRVSSARGRVSNAKRTAVAGASALSQTRRDAKKNKGDWGDTFRVLDEMAKDRGSLLHHLADRGLVSMQQRNGQDIAMVDMDFGPGTIRGPLGTPEGFRTALHGLQSIEEFNASGPAKARTHIDLGTGQASVELLPSEVDTKPRRFQGVLSAVAESVDRRSRVRESNRRVADAYAAQGPTEMDALLARIQARSTPPDGRHLRGGALGSTSRFAGKAVFSPEEVAAMQAQVDRITLDL